MSNFTQYYWKWQGSEPTEPTTKKYLIIEVPKQTVKLEIPSFQTLTGATPVTNPEETIGYLKGEYHDPWDFLLDQNWLCGEHGFILDIEIFVREEK